MKVGNTTIQYCVPCILRETAIYIKSMIQCNRFCHFVCMRYLQYSMPRIMSLKYKRACSSEKGLSVGTSITGLQIHAGSQTASGAGENKNKTRQVWSTNLQIVCNSCFISSSGVDSKCDFEMGSRFKLSDQTSLTLSSRQWAAPSSHPVQRASFILHYDIKEQIPVI